MSQGLEFVRGESHILPLLELIYSAVSDMSLWSAVIDHISEAAQGEQTLLFSPFQDPSAPSVLFSAKTDPDVPSLFLTHYHSVNVLNEPCDRMFPEGTVRYSHWALTDSEFERSEFYNDSFSPLKMHYSCGLKIPLSGRPPAYLSSQRSKARGPAAKRWVIFCCRKQRPLALICLLWAPIVTPDCTSGCLVG
jgi:hypothetical protein